MTLVSLITIGDELLKGRIINTNAAEIGQMLRRAGYTLHRVVTISDNREAIRQTVLQEMADHDLVLMNGGLGPTQDDLTKPTLAELFETELDWHAPTLAFLEQRSKERGRPLNELTRRQGFLPKAAEILPNLKGTAPGMCFQQGNKRLFSLPGVPFEMRYLMEAEVIPRIQQHFPIGYFDQQVIRLNGLPESEAAARIAALESQLAPEVSLAFLPRNDGLWLELSVRNEQAAPAMQANAAVIEDALQEFVYASEEGSLSELVGHQLREKKLTIAVAESLTGGNVVAKLVAIPGASTYVKGGIVAYDVSVKIAQLGVSPETLAAHTVVSAEVAREMADGVRTALGADIGIATTGIAQPGETDRPQAWVAYADEGKIVSEHVYLLSDRGVNIDRASEFALQLCWTELDSLV